MTVSVFAPAKVNLALHITGQRGDGYHLIDSLVAFAPIGDQLIIDNGDVLSLAVKGPEALGVPTGSENLVLKAANIIAPGQGLAMRLHKNLPAASGIGGGSADAAAAIRGILQAGASDENLADALALGADIAMCLSPRTQRVRGIGDQCEPVALPALPAVLVNPRVTVSTQDVFRALRQKEFAPMPREIPTFDGPTGVAHWLSQQRNDLQEPAIGICPDIGAVLNALSAQNGCLLARMSGSGATCFALFETLAVAQAAGAQLRRASPDWWVTDGLLGSWEQLAAPVIS